MNDAAAGAARADTIFSTLEADIMRKTDRMFACLMAAQWLIGIVFALWVSPRTWAAAFSRPHIHLYAAVLLGGVITSLPIALALLRPGEVLTRHVVAAGQVLTSALLIHLTGGRIETHFHVFGSLAFLAFYRDWRVLGTASLIVVLDHGLRGLYWPQSVYGLALIQPWRFMEHAAWVFFEDFFLIYSILQSRREMRDVSARQAQLEESNQTIERTVVARTAELTQAHARLKQLDELKSRFFANVSHELRTPLTLILGPTRQALAGAADGDERGRLLTVERNALLLLKHVNDILDIAKLEAGKMAPRYAVLDLAKLLRSGAANFELHARERRMELSIDAPAALVAEADQVKVERILLNLLANAFKFTPDGGWVRCALASSSGKAVLSVEDSGPGIPPELREAVFERFRQLDEGPARRFGGTGLGLAIAKEFAEVHGGTLAASEAPGGGARFTLELPLSAPPGAQVDHRHLPSDGERAELLRQTLESLKAVPAGLPAPANGAGDRPWVLVVEDNPEMSRYIAEGLAAEFNVAAAHGGRDGLEKAAQLRPSLILADLMMPDLGGEEMLAVLRADPALKAIPVVVLTAKGEEDLRLKLLKNGAQDYLLKPFAQEELLTRVRNLIRLGERTRELARANETLEAFNQSASHDLKAPLRHLHGFSEVLEHDYGDRLDNEGREHLKRIKNAARTLSRLVDAMTVLAQIPRWELRVAEVDLSGLVKSIVEDKRRDEPSRKIRVSVAEGLRAQGDEALLRIALTNLVANAWKFSARQDCAELEFGAVAADGGTAYFLRDNGVGFEMSDAAQLFTPFVKLHRPRDFPGSGIGLATVRRVIERHGGRIWARSSVGGGATFSFTLG